MFLAVSLDINIVVSENIVVDVSRMSCSTYVAFVLVFPGEIHV